MTPEELKQMNVIVPVLDMSVLQEKANEYAMKGCIETIKEYYSGYNSPFKKKIEEELKKQNFSWNMQLPDILALINDSLVKEMDIVANTAVLHSYVPMVKSFLTRVDPEIKFSDILKEFIDAVDAEYIDDCDVTVKEDMNHGWLNVTIEHEKRTYELTLHQKSSGKKDGRYQIISLPYNSWKDKNKMIFSMESGKVEMPFEKDVIKDDFLSYIAKVIMCQSVITMDTREFDDSMFEDRCHCH